MPIDPVCGKEINEADARSRTGQTLHGASEVDPQKGTRWFYNGQWVYFCSLGCRTTFMGNPTAYPLKK